MNTNKYTISATAFKAAVQNGLKRHELIAKFSTDEVKLVNNDITKLLKATGTTIKRTHKPKFVLVDDADTTLVSLVMDTDIAKEVKTEAEKGNYDYTSYVSTNNTPNNQ